MAAIARSVTDNPGIWLAILTVSVVIASWNIARLRVVRPGFDRAIALVGGGAILALVVGGSLVVASIYGLGSRLLPLAAVDLGVATALVTAFLRSDACRPERVVRRRAFGA